MNSALNQPWIPLEKIAALVQIEPALVLVGLAAGAWLAYKILLRGVSEERHRNLRGLFRNLLLHMITAIVLFIGYCALYRAPIHTSVADRFASYVGLLTLLAGTSVFVKTCRILLFEYLFLSHMKVAVPLLLVNLFTLLLSVFIGAWIATEVFGLQIAPLLATSAVLSLVLGLALQDTLGNLFAGVALQLDKPYEIGDWIEIEYETQKWVGQVREISWRASLLCGFTDELITVPNRVMSQSRIANYSGKHKPILRSQVFRVPYGEPIAKVKEALCGAASLARGIRKAPVPFVLVNEGTSDSWMLFKLIYFIDDFGAQYLIADEILSRGIDALQASGITPASPRLDVSLRRRDDQPA